MASSKQAEKSEHWNQESVYLANFASGMQEVSNFSGIGFRLMFSPLSKILSIHYFTINPFSLADSKKPQSELNNYVEQQTQALVEPYHISHSNGVFLNRNRRVIECGSRDLDMVEITNDIIMRVRTPNNLMMLYSPNHRFSG